MIDLRGKKLHRVLFFMGMAAVLAMAVPYCILGKDAIVTYHDQLDGELIAYLLQAKHLFDGSSIPEFLGGVSKTALMLPAPACVLLFLWGDGFVGLVIMQLLGSLCGYLGMYLLVKRETGNPLAAVIMGVLYGYLPFLPVYGLTQYGLPLLLFCVLEAEEGRGKAGAFLYAALFALNSSLVLAGFGVLGTMALWMFVRFLKKKNRAGLKNCLLMWAMMLGIYVVENCQLLLQMLGKGTGQGEAGISHKAEYRLVPEDMLQGFKAAFLQGGQHSEDYHSAFLWALVIVAACAVVWMHGKKNTERISSLLKVIGISFGCNIAFALAAALWNGNPGIFLRSHMQALGAFQMERFLWLAPCLWYLSLGCGLEIAIELWRMRGIYPKQKITTVIAGGLTLCMFAALCLTGGRVLLASNLKPNLQKVINPDYKAISYQDYYAIGVFSQIEDFLEETEGLSKEEYKVVSLGIDPAAALYHGFYCLDGYSNNYPLAYKHDFRKVLEPELEKSDYLADYFDNWGNRCYLFSAECPGYYTIEKGGFYFADYELNIQALRDLGGKYLFSAAYILNAEEQGLILLREEGFETPDSYYRIFVYKL